MGGCSRITGAGGRCRAIAITGSEYCHAHHPDRANDRQKAARKGGKRGGRGRPVVELAAIKSKLEILAENVLSGDVDRGDAAVVGQLYNTVIRAVATGLRAREAEEIEGRVEELEALLRDRDQEEGRYGA